MLPHADLLLTNARIMSHPRAEAVATQGEYIIAYGKTSEITGLKGPGSKVIDCKGLTILPGFIDAHCHLLALASSLTGIDCGPEKVTSIAGLKNVVWQQAQRTHPGSWIRGFGYDDLSLVEQRHPSRLDLDEVAPHHPVRLEHRSGHATVLNTMGLELAAIHRDTPDPIDGVIERDECSGEPTGLLLEMSGFLRERLGNTRSQDEFNLGVVRANRMLLEYGITSVQDAGPHNDLARWSTFQDLVESGKIQSRITVMVGASQVENFVAAGLRFGTGDLRLRLGHVKIMRCLTTGGLRRDVYELQQLVAAAHHAGFPVAIHAVEAEAVAAVAWALKESPRQAVARRRHPGLEDLPPDRIEHCAECPPELVAQVKESGAMVVTQPGFIYWNGASYLDRVEPEMLPHLYSIGALSRSDIMVAFGSDAPVIDPNPWPALCAAMNRQTRKGNYLPRGREARRRQQVSGEDNYRMYTIGGAYAEGTQTLKGSINPGKLADLVLVSTKELREGWSKMRLIRPLMTIVGGKVVWEREP